MTAGAILCGLACGALYAAGALALALLIGAAIARADRDAEAVDRLAQAAAQADEIALSMQFGGASDFHDFPLRTNLEQDRG